MLRRRKILSTTKNYLYSLSQIYQSCPCWVHCAFSLFPITTPPKCFWGSFLIPQDKGAQCWEAAYLCAYLCLLALAAYSDAFAFAPHWWSLLPLEVSHINLWLSACGLCRHQQFESPSFHANKWANIFQVATTESALLTRGKSWCCPLQNGHVCFNIVPRC